MEKKVYRKPFVRVKHIDEDLLQTASRGHGSVPIDGSSSTKAPAKPFYMYQDDDDAVSSSGIDWDD